MKKILLSALFLFFFYSLNAQQQGPNNPSFASYEYAGCLSCPGSEWINPANVFLADNQFAAVQPAYYPMCFQTVCYYTRGLIAQNFGFNVPANAAITGIKAEVLRTADFNTVISDTIVKLMSGGAAIGSNKAIATQWSNTLTTAAYGDSTDLWGVAWTPSMINASDFGLMFKILNKSANQPTASVDHIQITVYYTSSSSVNEISYSSDYMIVKPVDGWIDVSCFSKSNSEFTLQVFNVLGLVMFEETELRAQKNFRISTTAFPEGTYFVRMLAGENAVTRKVLVRK